MKSRFDLATVLFAAILLACVASTQIAANANPYGIVEIGAGRPYQINNQGQIAGSYTASDSNLHAFTYLTSFNDIGALGGTFAEAIGLNSSGTLVGYFATASDKSDAHGYIYDGLAHDIGNLGAAPTELFGINDSGTAVGFSTTGSGLEHAISYANSTISDLGTLGGTTSYARAINTGGTIVGTSTNSAGILRAFSDTGTSMTNLGGLSPNGASEALSVNSLGEVAGYSDDSGGLHHAVTFTNGVLSDLGAINGYGAYAEGINDSGVVVGWALNADGTGRAYENVSGKWINLASLLPSGSTWTLSTARAINNAGQITGEGIDPSGNDAVYLLTPTPFITQALPGTITTGSASTTITISGIGFAPGCTAYWNTIALSTTYVSSSTLTVNIPATLLSSQQSDVALTVVNPAVTANPVITVTRTTGVTGTTGTTTTTTGTTTSDTTTTTTNQTVIDTVANTSTVTNVVTVTDYLHGTITVTTTVTVTTLPWTSNAVTVVVGPPTKPTIQQLSQYTVETGSGGISLGVTGTNFVDGAVVLMNGSPLLTTYNSANSLTAYIPSTLLTFAGAFQITVSIGTVASNAMSLTVTGASVGAGIHSYSPGLQMISAPFDYTGSTLDQVFDQSGVEIVAYNTALSAYSGVDESPADTLHVGRGYWARFSQTTSLLFEGASTPGSSATIALVTGWNLIGNPFTTSVSIPSAEVLDQSGVSHTFAEATSSGLIGSPFYSYDQGSNSYITHSTDTLDPYFGYWLLANVDCTLVVAITEGTSGSTPPSAPI